MEVGGLDHTSAVVSSACQHMMTCLSSDALPPGLSWPLDCRRSTQQLCVT